MGHSRDTKLQVGTHERKTPVECIQGLALQANVPVQG